MNAELFEAVFLAALMAVAVSAAAVVVAASVAVMHRLYRWGRDPGKGY